MLNPSVLDRIGEVENRAMTEIICKRCGASNFKKNGIVRGHQRYHCHDCGCDFTMTPPRGRPPAMKALATLLYAMGNMSFCSIARLLGVSDVTVLKWIRSEARKLPEPKVESEQVILVLDEMWHFIQKKLASSGFGGPTTLWLGEPSPGLWVAVMTKPAKSSSTRSASKARPSSRTTGTATTASSRRTSSSPARI
jgi:transposase